MEMNKKDSTKFEGGYAPPASSYVHFKSMIVPMGKAEATKESTKQHNEYVVYYTDQVRIRYVVKLEMKGQ